MHASISLSLLTTIPVLVSAHFELKFPEARGDDDENQAMFPCGGYGQTQDRTLVPLDSIAVDVELGHTDSLFTVLLAIGNDVGDSFNTVLFPTIQEFGPGDFCLPSIRIPADLNITDGTNATIQVMTNAHGGGGLYNCADITFTSATTASQPSSCSNGTGISASPLAAGAHSFANQSTTHVDSSSTTTTSSATATGAGASSSASSTPNAAAAALTAGWAVLAAAGLGSVVLL